jgi:transcriptional regulator with XRE-family HTH domain
MSKTRTTRKAQFKAARALAGITVKQWAESRGVSFQHLNEVMEGRRESPRLDAEIDAFIAKYLDRKAVAVAS